jgi:hypothetical protein
MGLGPLELDHRTERARIALLIALLERSRTQPSTRCGDVARRKVLLLSGPDPSERVPEATIGLLELAPTKRLNKQAAQTEGRVTEGRKYGKAE